MRRVLMTMLVGAAMAAAASPAYATIEVSAPTAVGCSTGPLAPPADKCAGYYSGNEFNAADVAQQQAAINLLLGPGVFTVNWTDLVNAGKVVSGSDLTALNNLLAGAGGQVVLGLHWGNVPGSDAGNVSALYLWDNAPLGSIHLTNTQGYSNAVLYVSRAAVPESATWAMMLLGFGGIGMAMRRGRRQKALMQVA